MSITIKYVAAMAALLCAAALSYAGGAPDSKTGGLSLRDAIEQSAERIAEQLPAKSRVAVVAFESQSGKLSDYIMEELAAALFDRNIEVADRQNLEYIYKELNFQMSGDVSDETAQSIGKFLGAELVITGQLRHLGDTYRFMAAAIRVEEATRASVPRFDVRNDKAMRNMVAAIDRQTTTTRTASYGVSENRTPQTAGTFLDRGIMFAMRGEYDMAIADFGDALRLGPNMVGAYILRGRALFASASSVTSVEGNFSGIIVNNTGGRITAEQARIYDRAIDDLNQAIRLDPGNAGAYVDRGRVYMDKGDSDRAIADYNQALRLNPNFARAYNNRGVAYYNKKDYDRAIADYTQAIRLDPHAVAYNNRGIDYANKKDYDRAIADYTQAIRLDPNYASAYTGRGNAYSDGKRDYNRAIADYTQAIRLNPNYVAAYNNRGNAYLNKNDYDRAIADYTQAIRLDPNHASAYNGRGNAYNDGKRDYDRAIADYTQAIRLDPNYASAYRNRALAYERKRDYDRAIADYTQAIRLDPNYAAAYRNRGLAYNDGKRDYDRAIADYTQAIRLDPNYAVAYNSRGNAYNDGKRDYDRAIADYTQAIRLDPNYALAYINRALAYERKRDWDRAIADYTSALRINPKDANAKKWLADARKARKR